MAQRKGGELKAAAGEARTTWQSETPESCLGIHGRIPIRVIKDHSIGTRQVDAETSTSSR